MDLTDQIEAIRLQAIRPETWAGVHAYMHSQILRQFQESAKGGTSRGVHWPYFKTAWYTRNDGTEVPIWGGVPKAEGYGKGNVKAKKRGNKPGGKRRYKQGDSLMQNTGILRGAMLADMQVSDSKIELLTPVIYAGTQDAMRPFSFITDGESQMIHSMITGELF